MRRFAGRVPCKTMSRRLPALLVLVPVLGAAVGEQAKDPASASAIVESEFVFQTAPFASAHASTLVETSDGLVAAWFGGSREGAADVGIWLSRRVKGGWTPPVEVASGVQPDGTRHPCWNPVLFEMATGELWLFYKVGPGPQRWWGMVRTSRDGPHVERCATAARWHPRSDQEQAGAAV